MAKVIRSIPFQPKYKFDAGGSLQLVGLEQISEPIYIDGMTEPEPGSTVEFSRYNWREVQWLSGESFEATVRIAGQDGVKRVSLVDDKRSLWYSMTLGDFVDAMQVCDVKDGVFSAVFKFVKKGRTYAVSLLRATNSE